MGDDPMVQTVPVAPPSESAVPAGLGKYDHHASVRLGRLEWWRREGPFLAVLLVACTLLTTNVGTPFWGLHEDNAVVFTEFASSHLRLGLSQTEGEDVFATVPPEELWRHAPGGVPDHMWLIFHTETVARPYGHHPPLLGLTIAGAIAVFGEHTAVVRAVPIAFSLLALVLFYLLMVRLFDRGIARVASALFATFPIFAYFGRNVCHEAPVLFFALALIWCYLRWRDDDQGRRRWAALMVACVVLGAYYGWAMQYFVALLFVFDWASRRRFDWRLLLMLAVPAVMVFAVVVAQIIWVGSLSGLTDYFLLRTGEEGVYGTEPSVGQWIQQIIAYMSHHDFGLITILLAPLAVGFVVYRAFREKLSQRTMVVALLGSWGTFHVLLFRHGAWEHLYWQFYLIPFVAVTFAWPGVLLARRYLRPLWLRSSAFVVVSLLVLAMQLPRIVSFYEMGPYGHVPAHTLWETFFLA